MKIRIQKAPLLLSSSLITQKNINLICRILQTMNELVENERKNKTELLKKMFLIDGIGALVSAILLGIVLVYFEVYFGIPKSTLYVLAALPCAFAFYDFYCLFKVKENLEKHLKRIAVVNLLYCCFSIGMALYHSTEIKLLGWAYIIIEVMIVVALALFELKIAKKQPVTIPPEL